MINYYFTILNSKQWNTESDWQEIVYFQIEYVSKLVPLTDWSSKSNIKEPHWSKQHICFVPSLMGLAIEEKNPWPLVIYAPIPIHKGIGKKDVLSKRRTALSVSKGYMNKIWRKGKKGEFHLQPQIDFFFLSPPKHTHICLMFTNIWVREDVFI